MCHYYFKLFFALASYYPFFYFFPPLDLSPCDIDHILRMDLDYSNFSSLLSSPTKHTTPATSSIHQSKATSKGAATVSGRVPMNNTQPSPIKSGSLLSNDGEEDTRSPLTERKCYQLIVSLQRQIKKQQACHSMQLDDALQKLASTTNEKKKLQKKLEETEAKLRRSNTTNNVGDVCLAIKKDLKELLESQAKSILWGMVKFIQSPAEEMMAAKMLVKCAESLPEEEVATKEDRDALANTYKSYIRKAIFQRRNYVAAEHKKVMVKRFKEKGSMPTVSQILKCLQRDITSDQDYDIFQFYWEELLPKQVGSCVWSKDVRNYTTISEAIRKDVTHKSMPMITSEDEAFTVLVVENSYDRWMKEIQEKDGAQQQDDTSIKKKRPNYNGRYTTTDSGQNEWGGWTDEGLAIFNRYVDINRAARKEKKAQAIERACLALLKKKYNIVCNDHKTQTDLNKKRKKKGDDDIGEKEKKKPLLTIRPEFHNVFSDEEDDNAAPADSDDDSLPLRPTKSKSQCLLPHTPQCSTPVAAQQICSFFLS
jgi:hypothetical protein